jgi:hypothetical protein
MMGTLLWHGYAGDNGKEENTCAEHDDGVILGGLLLLKKEGNASL